MTILLRSLVTEVGPDAAEMISSGVLILFAHGAPPELAEISVLHKVAEGPSEAAPSPGAALSIGEVETVLTGVGSHAWAKIRDIGHVVVNFNSADVPERPGELCAAEVNADALLAAIRSGAEIRISA